MLPPALVSTVTARRRLVSSGGRRQAESAQLRPKCLGKGLFVVSQVQIGPPRTGVFHHNAGTRPIPAGSTVTYVTAENRLEGRGVSSGAVAQDRLEGRGVWSGCSQVTH